MWTMGAFGWIRYGWGNELATQQVIDQQLNIDLSGCTSATEQPLVAAVLAVHEIAKNYPAPYTLMCSGGVDSQVMIWAWHLSNIPFEIVSVRYVSNGIWFNDHDLIQLTEFSSEHGFSVTYKDFDIISFLEEDLPNVAKENMCDSPQICTHIKMTELVPTGTILFGGNYISPMGATLSNTLLGLHRYSVSAQTPDRQIIPFFLLHDPQLAMSFLPLHSNQRSSQDMQEPGPIYKIAGFPIIPQPSKLNGFEKVKIFYDDDKYYMRVSCKDRLLYARKPSKRTFDLLFRYPYERESFLLADRTVKFIMRKI